MALKSLCFLCVLCVSVVSFHLPHTQPETGYLALLCQSHVTSTKTEKANDKAESIFR